VVLVACSTGYKNQIHEITVFPDHVLNDLSNKPLGVNLDFFMDGGRYPNAEQTVEQAMKKMGMKFLRYPGGEKSDLYLFSLPPYTKSSPKPARNAGLNDYPGMFTDDNDFVYDPLDFDEYIAICREAGAEPVVVVAADYYLIDVKDGETVTPREKLIEHAAAWVRYANLQKGYGVKYWMVGNESWNNNNKNSTVEIYARDVVDFAKAMKAVDSSILVIANGDSDEFFKTLIETSGDYIDRLCVSNYGVWYFPRGYASYRDTMQCLINPSLIALDAMNKYATPEQLKKWKLIVAEYGTIDWAGNWTGENDMGHAIVSFDMTGQLLQQPQIEFSCYWNTRWIENETKAPDHDVLDKNGNILPTGHALSIWTNCMGEKIVKTQSKHPLVSYATVTPKTAQLYVYIINKTSEAQAARIETNGYAIGKMKHAWEYYGQSPEDKSPVWEELANLPNDDKIQLKGNSISIYEFEITPEK
jgi:hypothetical protein